MTQAVPFKLRIAGYDEASLLAAAGWPTHIISAMNAALPQTGSAAVLHVVMDDIIRPEQGSVQPTMQHLRAVMEFTKDLTHEHRLLIHCMAGRNRSTAIGIAVLIQHGMGWAQAFAAVAHERPNLAPNRLLTAFIDQHFALDGQLRRLVIGHECRTPV